MTKEKVFPSKNNFEWILIKKFAFSDISIIMCFLTGLFVTLGCLIDYANLTFHIVSLVANILALAAIFFARKLFPWIKESMRLNIILHYVLISILIAAVIFSTLNFILQFTAKLLLLSLLPAISFSLTFLASKYIEIHKFVKSNYEVLEKKQRESYDVLEKSNLYFDGKSDGTGIYLFLSIIKFFFSSFILVFAAILVNVIAVPKIILPNAYVQWIVYIPLLMLPIVVICLFALLTYSFESTTFFHMLICFLSVAVLFKFFTCENDDLNYVFHLLNTIFACAVLVIIRLNKLFEDKACLFILNAVKSKFYKKELDYIMLDEPIDNIEAIGNINFREIAKLHNILEKTDSNVPLTISYVGEWGCGKSSIIKTLSVQLSKINRYSIAPLNINDKYKKRYFTVNLDLMKFESPIEIVEYIYGYMSKLCRVFSCDTSKSIDAYFKNMIELLADCSNIKSLSLLSKIANNTKHRDFSTIEDKRYNFQQTINKLLKISKRAGVILFIDDIDRLSECENMKTYYLLKEFFNIYGFKTVILKGHDKDNNANNEETFKLDKFINVEFKVNDSPKNNIVSNAVFENFISIAARGLNLDNNIEAQNPFIKLDTKLCHNAFTECINEILSRNVGSTKSQNENRRKVDKFNLFLESLYQNPRTYKKILRKAYLENVSIIETLVDVYEQESAGFKEMFTLLIS